MNINVKKIFLMLAVLGFAGQSFASKEARASFSPTKVRRQASSRKLAAPATPAAPAAPAAPVSWRTGMKKESRKTDFGLPARPRK